eukprot:Platyproteum_vivax@DN5995_c0_g1_i1.p1
MAQTFVGANNVNLLEPSGQFGSRKEGGKDCASARYVYTRLSPITRCMFHEDDDALLEYDCEEGQWIEPKWYVPVIPQILVNGALGIGTGWSTSIPNYDPRHVILNLKRYLRRQPMEEMMPWYRWFEGEIVKNAKGGWESVGKFTKLDSETLEITELPIKTWTSPYREFLEELLTGKDKDKDPKDKKDKKDSVKEKEPFIKDFRDNSAHHSVSFTISLSPDKMAAAEKEGIEKKFKLRSAINTSNMTLFGPDGRVYRYNSPLDILKEFGNVRIDYYRKRKAYLLDRLDRERDTLDNKARFVLMVVRNEIIVNNKKKKALLKELKTLKFKTSSELKKGENKFPHGENPEAPAEEEEEDVPEGELKTSDYDYLVGMPLWNLTEEKVQDLLKQLEDKKEQIDLLKKTAPELMWDRDLDKLMTQVLAADQRYWLEMNDTSNIKGAGKGGKAKAKAKGKGKRKAWSDSDDAMSSDSYKPQAKKSKTSNLKADPWGDTKTKGGLFDRLKKEKGSPSPVKHAPSIKHEDGTQGGAEQMEAFESLKAQPIPDAQDLDEFSFGEIEKHSWTEETKRLHMVKKEQDLAAKASKAAKAAAKKSGSIASSTKAEPKSRQGKLKLEKTIKDEWHSSAEEESDDDIESDTEVTKTERPQRSAAINAQKKVAKVATSVTESVADSEMSDASSVPAKKPKAKAKAKSSITSVSSVDPLESLGWGKKSSPSPKKSASPKKKRVLKKAKSDSSNNSEAEETPLKKVRAVKKVALSEEESESESEESDYSDFSD